MDAKKNIIVPRDEKLNCEQLKNAVAETQKIKKDVQFWKFNSRRIYKSKKKCLNKNKTYIEFCLY